MFFENPKRVIAFYRRRIWIVKKRSVKGISSFPERDYRVLYLNPPHQYFIASTSHVNFLRFYDNVILATTVYSIFFVPSSFRRTERQRVIFIISSESNDCARSIVINGTR